MKLLITGGDEFIARSLCKWLDLNVYDISILVDAPRMDVPQRVTQIVQGDIWQDGLPNAAVDGIDVLLHLAGAEAHNTSKSAPALSKTVQMAKIVATAAQRAGVKRVVVKSSIAAQIAETDAHMARQYGLEKSAADDVFRQTLDAAQSVVFLRPPAVYGPGATGPLATLSALVRRGMILPLGAARVKRPYLFIDNFCDLIEALLQTSDTKWKHMAGTALICRDGSMISTADLVRSMGDHMGRPARLIYVPAFVLRLAGRLTGKQSLIQAVLDPVPCSPSAQLVDVLGWTPKHDMPQSLAYLKQG